MLVSTNLVVDDCPEGLADEVDRLVGIELGLRSDTSSSGASLRLSCGGIANTSIVLAALLDGRRVRREIELDTVDPRSRSRILAIALVELLDDPALSPPPPPALPPPARPPAPPPRPPHPPPSRLRWAANVGAILVADPTSIGVAAAGTVTYRLVGPLVVGGDLAADFARRSADRGSLQKITASISASALYRSHPGPFTVDLGGGIRSGFASLAGRPEAEGTIGDDLRGWFWGPFVAAGVLVPVTDTFGMGLGFEVGRTVAGAEGGEPGGTRIGIDGTWIRLTGVVAWPN